MSRVMVFFVEKEHRTVLEHPKTNVLSNIMNLLKEHIDGGVMNRKIVILILTSQETLNISLLFRRHTVISCIYFRNKLTYRCKHGTLRK